MARSPRRLRRWLVAIGLGLVLLVGTGVVILRVKFNGDALGDQIERLLNRRMRGRIEIGSIEWPMSALPTVVTGGWVPVTLTDVTVWDRRSDARTRDCFQDKELPPPRQVLRAPRITAELDIHALMFGRHDMVFRHVLVDGGDVRLEQIREPYPLHAYDKTSISLIASFYPCMKAGFRAGFYAGAPPPVFDLRDVEVRHVDLAILIGPDDTIPYRRPDGPAYRATLEIADVNASHAFVYMDPTDPLVSRLYFSLAPRTGPATLYMFDTGVKPAAGTPADQLGAAPDEHHPTYSIEMTSIDVTRLAQLPDNWPRASVANSLRIEGVAHLAEGGTLDITGDLIDWWDRQFDGQWNILVAGRELGPTLHDDILPPLGGPAVTARLSLTGPFIALPKLDFELGGLRYDVLFTNPTLPVLELQLDKLVGWVDFVNANGSLDTTVATAHCVRATPDRCGPPPPGGDVPGQVELSASFGLPLNLNANLDITQPLDLGPWLPPIARESFGRFLRGRMRAIGKSDQQLGLTDIDLALGRSRGERLTHIYGGQIYTANSFTAIELEALRVAAGATAVTVNGGMSFANQSFGFDIAGHSDDLATWLRRFGAPRIATAAADARVDIEGRWVDGELQLGVDGKASLRGVPTVDQVDVVARLEDDLLFIDSLSSPGLGGLLTGSGEVRLGKAPFIEKLELEGSGLDIKKLPIGAGAVTGTIRAAKLTARGSIAGKRDVLDWFSLASGYLTSDDVAVLGDRYDDAAVCINYADDELCRRPGTAVDQADLDACDAAKHGGTCVVARAARADGGSVDLTVASPARERSTRKNPAPPPPLAGALAVRDAPLEIITRMLGKAALPIGGSISADLRVGGTRTAPTARGEIDLLRAWVLGAFVGDTGLEVAPDPDDPHVVVIRGKALHERLDLIARVGTAAPYPIDVTVSGRRIELDPLLDLTALVGAKEPLRAWATGTVSLHAELAGKAEPVAWVELDELGAILDHRDPDGRPVPLRLTALRGTASTKALSVRATPSSLAFVCRGEPGAPPTPCPVRLATPAGIIELSGDASRDHLALAAVGTLDLRLVAPLLDVYFDEVSGTAELAAALGGTLAAPAPSAEITLRDVRLRPVGQETVVRVPGGQVKLSNGSLGFSDVRVRVDDTYLGEKAELVIKGGIGLEGLRPHKWGVIIEGQVAGKMLLAAAPALISQASGVAQIDGAVWLKGTGLLPAVEGTIKFDAAQPLTIIPRGVRRELAFFGGSLSVDEGTASNDLHRSYAIAIESLSGSIDGEGTLHDIDGELEIARGGLVSADITLDADAIPFRVPHTLDLVLNADQLRLSRRGAGRAWAVSGRKVELVTGRYIRNFDLGQVLRPSASTGSTKPFWEEYPELGEATLDLAVDVRQFSVANNIANIEMAGSNLRLSGTPRDPRIDGQIRVQSGTFRLTGTRASFTRTEGSVLFARQARVPTETPTLDIQSEADYRDPSGQDHLITLRITGTIPNLSWDLYTSTGFDKAQTMSLILLGRTPEQLRRSLGDQAIGSDPTRLDASTTQAGNPLDQVLRDFAGDTISLLVEDSLKQVSRLDVARPFATVGSWGFHGEKKVYDNINIIGDYEQLYRGGRTINVRAEFRMPYKPYKTGDPLTFQGNYLDKSFEDAAEEDVSDLQLKLVYRFFIP